MHSLIVLAAVACVIAVPGIAAALAAFSPGEVAIVTRTAAAFGLGYAAAGGCASWSAGGGGVSPLGG